jgi:hypothetical protein
MNTLLSNPIISVKIAEPITDHITGKGFPWIEISKKGGKPNFPATHMPMYAPIKPTTIDTRHPPKLYPAIDWPTAPQTAAINKSNKNPKSVIE